MASAGVRAPASAGAGGQARASMGGAGTGMGTGSRPAGAGSSSGGGTSSGSGSTSSSSLQQPQISMLGTMSYTSLPALLRHVEGTMTQFPPELLCERETVLGRHDDETSSIRETGDNAWASVVKSRRGVRLRVCESLRTGISHERAAEAGVECRLHLPLPALPERQYPRAAVRPSYTSTLLSDRVPVPYPPHLPQPQGLSASGIMLEQDSTTLGFDPELLDTDRVNGWKSFVSAIGWSRSSGVSFVRLGLSYPLNETFSRFPGTSNALNPTLKTKHSLNVYRIFAPDPSGYTQDWVPLDPLGATVVVELISTVAGQLDQAHFNRFVTASSDPNTANQGGLDPNSTIDAAVEFADYVAKSLRGFVDLRREAAD
ncbi:hypothetical protein BCV70DRAFT_202017 [Testicularia cyperi]|uniref:Uncharacterized protein n=1 Tax=Testicularia cyperi TaxID=1882483 RepID=A0A317XJI0_9BASI|nr:hypothetical protein BCV70DRAFT_202017 [Testicularia cyperi]